MWQAADLGGCHGGIMRIKQTIIIPAILALSALGSITASSVVPVVAAQTVSATASPNTYYHA